MKSIKRILAVIALILIAAMYVVTLILAFSRSEAAGRWFIASLACTFLFPALLYIYLWIYKVVTRDHESKSDDK